MHLQQKLDPLMKVVEISADSVADKAPNIDIANIGIANIDYVSNTNNIDAIG